MTMPNIIPGDIITSTQLPEPAKVIQVFPDGPNLRIMAVGVDSNQFYDRTYAPGEVSVRRVTFAADGERFRLAVLADRPAAAPDRRGLQPPAALAAHPLSAGRRPRRRQDDYGWSAAERAGASWGDRARTGDHAGEFNDAVAGRAAHEVQLGLHHHSARANGSQYRRGRVAPASASDHVGRLRQARGDPRDLRGRQVGSGNRR